MAKAKATFWYKVIAGDHVHNRVHYEKGAFFESDIPWLAERYPEKFEKLFQPPTKRQLEITKHLVTGLVPLAEGMEGAKLGKKSEPAPPTSAPAVEEDTDAEEGFDESLEGAPPASDEAQPPTDEPESETEDEPSAEAETPSKSIEEMDTDELRAYAASHKIDLKGNTSLNGMRRIIRRAGGV